jgi:hypothetical protein
MSTRFRTVPHGFGHRPLTSPARRSAEGRASLIDPPSNQDQIVDLTAGNPSPRTQRTIVEMSQDKPPVFFRFHSEPPWSSDWSNESAPIGVWKRWYR